MVEVTVEEFEKNFDAFMDRIENNKESFLVKKPDGTAVVAVPVFLKNWNLLLHK